MPHPRDPGELLRRSARALRADLDDLVVVGGCAPVMYELSLSVSEFRPTTDVDYIVETAGRPEYYDLIKRLEQTAQLRHVTRTGVPICRYEVDGVEIDLMPIDPADLGFAGLWYADTVATARRVEIEAGLVVRVATPLYFVAMKLDAMSDRGNADLRVDEDLEDIITVLRGVDHLIDEIAAGTEPVHVFVRAGIGAIIARTDAREVLDAHFESDRATQDLVPGFLDRLRAACA
jgi:predicted nucleotidyltransferase